MPNSAGSALAEQEPSVLAPMFTRELEIRAETFDEASNSVEVVFTTGARGARFNWERWAWVDEELSTDPGQVRLDRLNNGAPVLNTHQSYDLENQIGVVEPGSARMENGLGIARVRLSARPEVASIVADIRAGIIRNISVGYRVHTFEVTERDGERPLYRAIDWEPYEISFVPMPFDAGAQTRSGNPEQGGFPCIIRRTVPATVETNMPNSNPQVAGDDPANIQTRDVQPAPQPAAVVAAPEQTRSAPPATVTTSAIRSAVRNAGLGDEIAFELIERHETAPLTNDALMADIGRRFAERDSGVVTTNRVSVTRDAGDTMRRGLTDAIFHRMSPGAELSEQGRVYRGMSLLRMAEEFLVSEGVSVRGLSASEIAERALHSTSDFANLVGSGLNRRLRAAYEENQPTYRRWARRAPNAPDFRSIDIVQMSAMPDLLKVAEGGEFKYGTAVDGKVSYSVATYGRIFSVTRQLLINDDLRALERVVSGFAGSAARLENRIVYGLLFANAAMPDGTALFHSNHGNLAASGGAIDGTTLGTGRAAMRLQKGLQNEELNLAPRFLLAPATQEQKAYQYTSASYVPATQSNINEFRAGGRTAVEPIIDAVLDGNSTTAWYLLAGSEQVDTAEYCYLDGSEGVQMSNRVGFTVDGVELKASLDFAAGVIDHRGLYKNPGA